MARGSNYNEWWEGGQLQKNNNTGGNDDGGIGWPVDSVVMSF